MKPENAPKRNPLTRERVLRAAVGVADRDGLTALTMRRLGAGLGVEAMALYKHVADKDEIIDGILELVVAEIEVPAGTAEWRDSTWRRAVSMREVLRRHPWALGLLERRGLGGRAQRQYVDAVLRNLRLQGFSVAHAAHAFWLVDSFVYGHAVQEVSLKDGGGRAPLAGTLPTDGHAFLSEVAEDAARSDYSVDQEFEFGLRLILDGLEAYRGRE